MNARPSLTRFAWLSVVAALATMALKGGAYLISGSVALLSDALESGVNLTAALLALAVLTVVAQPPDEEHAYGHEKAEYFSSGAEGSLILIAAVTIAYQAIRRLLIPVELARLPLGLTISVVAMLINLFVAIILRRAARRHRSIALEADSQHLMTDVWSSVGVLGGVGAVALTGWQPLDPLVALAAALHIGWSGTRLIRRSIHGLMDTALPERELAQVREILDEYRELGIRFHALRSRQAGARSFVSFHVQVPGDWSVQRGHDLLEAIERKVRHAIPATTVFTHIEPVEDPRSWHDQKLDRETEPRLAARQFELETEDPES